MTKDEALREGKKMADQLGVDTLIYSNGSKWVCVRASYANTDAGRAQIPKLCEKIIIHPYNWQPPKEGKKVHKHWSEG